MNKSNIIKFMRSFTNLKYAQIIASAVLLGAIYIEVFLHQLPCVMCQYERIGWLTFIFISLIYPNRWILSTILIVSLGITGYQIFTQYSVVSNICPIDVFNTSAPICSSKGYTVLGFPLTVYNALALVIAMGLVIIKRK